MMGHPKNNMIDFIELKIFYKFILFIQYAGVDFRNFPIILF